MTAQNSRLQMDRTPFMRNMRNGRGFLSVIVILLFLIGLHTAAFGAYTIEDEKKTGKEFYDKLAAGNVLEKNPKVTHYITILGNRVLEKSDKAPFDFRFSVIKSDAVNAFATPGGYIYLNSGLIALVENEAELAGVLAHEIAHANARHIASIADKATKINAAMLAAIIAGAFLGGDIGGAAIGFSLAAGQTLGLKYSREHEEEADRLGIDYLIRAGYNGNCMPDFLKLMRKYEFYSSSMPSYFRTHPGTDDRIRYLDALLQTTYRGEKGSDQFSTDLKRVQTILWVNSPKPDSALKHFQEGLERDPNDIDDLYGYAMVLDKLGRTDEALAAFRKVLNRAPTDGDILRDAGIAYFKAGRPAEAVLLLRKASATDPGNELTIRYLGRAYAALEDYDTALKLYQKIESRPIEDTNLYYDIAMAYGKTNHPGESHYFFGLHFKKNQKVDTALYHFRAALAFFPKDSQKARDIDAEIKSLKSAKKEPPKEKTKRELSI